MRIQLTNSEKDELKLQCRMGYIIPFMFFIISTTIVVSIYEMNFNIGSALNYQTDFIIMGIFTFISIAISFAMNNKYYADIRYNEKIVEPKLIQRKVSKTDYEPGTGNGLFGEMKSFIRYDLIIENTKFKVDKTLFDSVKDGDEVVFMFAPKSKYLLGINTKM